MLKNVKKTGVVLRFWMFKVYNIYNRGYLLPHTPTPLDDTGRKT